jgi:precorrin-6Y C5,15-methyltransferase (decarboxylating)
MAEIFDAVLAKNPQARIVTSAIVLQTLQAAMEAFKKHGIEPEIVQISSAASKRVGGMDMMMARNPIFIISGGVKH